jgi:hypothetical protein
MTTALERTALPFEIELPVSRRLRAKAPSVTVKDHALAASTDIHPAVFGVPLLAAVWFLVVAWAAVAGGETSLVLAFVTLNCLMFLGLLVGCAAMARDVRLEQRPRRSLSAFLDGQVGIATGRVGGWQAFRQIALMPVAVAACATAMAFAAVAV